MTIRARFGTVALLTTVVAANPISSAQTPPTTAPPAVAPTVVAPVVPVAPPAPVPIDPRTVFAGTFYPDPGPANRNAIEAGISRAVNELFFLVRGIAHGRILSGNPLFPFIRFAFPPGMIEMTAGNYVTRSPDNGGEGSVHGLDGNTNRLTQRFAAPDRLVQITWNNDGRRHSEYVLSPDGHSLALSVVITAPQLPVPVRYTIHYHR